MKALQSQNKKAIKTPYKYNGGNIRVTNSCPVTNSFMVPQLQIPQNYPPILYFCEVSCLRCMDVKHVIFVFWLLSLNVMISRLIHVFTNPKDFVFYNF